jgi:hypothetical protein
MMFTFKTRSINRAQWKAIWRQQRIINRETRKAALDCLVFGTGYLEVGAHLPDLIHCIDPSTVFIEHEGVPV